MTWGQGYDLDHGYSHIFIFIISCLHLPTFRSQAAIVSENPLFSLFFSIEMFSNKTYDGLECQMLHIKLCGERSHYANMSVQYTAMFHRCKNGNFQINKCNIFLIFAQNIDRGYTLEPPQWGGSNEYPQSMF